MFNKLKSNPSLLFNNPSICQDYYLYYKTKLSCDKSLHLIEVRIFTNFYGEYFARHKSDYLLNTKILMYKESLFPYHLNITNIDTNNIKLIESIGTTKIPSEMLQIYLEFIKIHSKVEHDSFLNILVYCIIKSNVKDFNIIVGYIKKYRRKVFISCEHKLYRNETEIEYYLNVLEIALKFIGRMEFNDLNITQEEYEKLIGCFN